jgi:hypothetical protein
VQEEDGHNFPFCLGIGQESIIFVFLSVSKNRHSVVFIVTEVVKKYYSERKEVNKMEKKLI